MKRKLLCALMLGIISFTVLHFEAVNGVGKLKIIEIYKSNNLLTLEKLTKIYENEGLVKEIDDEFKGYNRVLLKDPSNSKKAGIFVNDSKVVRSFLTTEVKNKDTNEFKDLGKIVFKELIPNFKDADEWLKYIIPLALDNSGKEYIWVRNNKRISLDYYENKLNLDITEVNHNQAFFKENENKSNIIKLDSNGKLPNKH